MVTNDQRLQALRDTSETIADLYGSLALAQRIGELRQQVHPEKGDAFIHAIGDTILGFYQTKDLPSLLQRETGLSADAAQRVVANLAELLTPVLERERMLANPKLGEVKALHQQFAASGGQPGATEAAATPPPTTEEPESLHNVTPMRTMASDMNRIHGYGAYRQANPAASAEEPVVQARPQSEILQSRQPLTGVPKVGE